MLFVAGVFVLHLLFGGNVVVAQLSSTFYRQSCPDLPWLVGRALYQAIRNEPRMGASILRLHFHDCFVNGCDASVLLDDTPSFKGEKSAMPNRNSARGFEVIDQIKELVEQVCPGVVSCADILTLAAAESVALLGGPMWTVYFGRRDSTFASLKGANNDIPVPNSTINMLVAKFAAKGLYPRDLVALSGAHTIGMARCLAFRDRLYNFRGTGRADPDLEPSFQESLQEDCPFSKRNNDNSNVFTTALDLETPARFDNSYFRNLRKYLGLLTSDQVLYSSWGVTRELVEAYADDSNRFFDDFATAMVRLGNLRPLTGSQGQIRSNCRQVNDY